MRGPGRHARSRSAQSTCVLVRPQADANHTTMSTITMSKLSALITDATAGLSIQERISDARWDAIAGNCGPFEVEEIEARIMSLRAELAIVEAWNGDTQDDIHLAISRFSRLLALAGTSRDANG